MSSLSLSLDLDLDDRIPATGTDSVPHGLLFNVFHASASLRPEFEGLVAEDIPREDGCPPLCIIADVFMGHFLQDRLSKGAAAGKGRSDEIYLKLRTSTGMTYWILVSSWGCPGEKVQEKFCEIRNNKEAFTGNHYGFSSFAIPDIAEMIEAAALLCPISYLDHISAPLVLRAVKMHLDQMLLTMGIHQLNFRSLPGLPWASGSGADSKAQSVDFAVLHLNAKYVLSCGKGITNLNSQMDNGNLEQWIHGDVGPTSPLTWDIRMNIILGTAKGLMYLHEGLEPKVVHRDVKSSNILLDRHWNPKVSDFGLAKLLGSERSYVTTRVMGTFGYVAPEYASTGMLNEKSDVYSFGILIMEIMSGRNPVDYSRPPGEVNLVEWLKAMVSNRNSEGVLDPKMPEKPSSRALKRSLLVALRCVDPDSQKRPKMGHVIHMLEVDDFPYRDDSHVPKLAATLTAERTSSVIGVGLCPRLAISGGQNRGDGGVTLDEISISEGA
ncbi:hypothetical protein Taro_046035 [Colocasia esculenta]|uniref:non-specific serine/threonine protein kinase n=1 Tax=Colocasia esculenta TaxID=4460 RepID=A0A843WR60_COLES|nr:hypothetical protein [Colocasia esculenta]